MSREADNERFVRIVQQWLASQDHAIAVDGWAGKRTRRAWSAATGSLDLAPAPGDRPAPDDRSLREFYGEPGDESNLVMLELPYPMRLAWQLSTTVTRTRCHRRVADPLRAALEGVLKHYGSMQDVRDAGMDRFGGVYNFRRQRGSGRGRPWSLHAWGGAIDLDPRRNQLDMPWRHATYDVLQRAIERWNRKGKGRIVYAKMSPEVVAIFEAVGWKSGARSWGRDAMHFQWTL